MLARFLTGLYTAYPLVDSAPDVSEAGEKRGSEAESDEGIERRLLRLVGRDRVERVGGTRESGEAVAGSAAV